MTLQPLVPTCPHQSRASESTHPSTFPLQPYSVLYFSHLVHTGGCAIITGIEQIKFSSTDHNLKQQGKSMTLQPLVPTCPHQSRASESTRPSTHPLQPVHGALLQPSGPHSRLCHHHWNRADQGLAQQNITWSSKVSPWHCNLWYLHVRTSHRHQSGLAHQPILCNQYSVLYFSHLVHTGDCAIIAGIEHIKV